MNNKDIFNKINEINKKINIHQKALEMICREIPICEKAIKDLETERHFLIQQVVQKFNPQKE